MGKSLKNMVTPDDMYDAYGADTFRVYEMSMGPLDVSRPWETRAVVGAQRFLQRVWRSVVDERTGELVTTGEPLDDATLRALHRAIHGVRTDMQNLRLNTAVAKLTELNNALTKVVGAEGRTPREVAEAMVLLLAPLAPHVGEELWHRLGHDETVVWQPFPDHDPALLVDATIEIPVQVGGKVRARIQVAADADAAAIEAAALADDKVIAAIGTATVRRIVTVPSRLVNVVT
jgi:leucyl-tRNA synthetase